MSKAKFVIATTAMIAFSGIVACSHNQKRSQVDASAAAPATEPSIESGTTTTADETSTAPTDLGASTSGRGL